MTWILLAALGGFFSNVYSFCNRYTLKSDANQMAYGWFLEFARLAAFTFIALVTSSFYVSTESLLLLMALGLVELVSITAIVKMHSYSHLSISTIISRTRILWIPIIAFLFLGEHLNVFSYIGIFVLFAGLSVAVAPSKIFVDKGVAFSYLSAFVSAIIAVLQKSVTDTPVSMIMIFMSLPSVIILPFFMKSPRKEIRLVTQQKIWIKTLAATANALAMYFYIFALQGGEVSKVSAIYQGMFILSIFAGIFLLGERKDATKKITGSFIALLGVLLLTSFS